MRRTFREWYPPTPEELEDLWKRAIVVLDANVLLGLYQYPPDTLREFLRALEGVQDRLWLPHQVGLEFQRNREAAIPQQQGVLRGLLEYLEGLSGRVDNIGPPQYHPILDYAEFEARRFAVRAGLESLAEHVQDALTRTPAMDPISGDRLFDQITTIFEGKVGNGFNADEAAGFEVEAERRFGEKIPPGYEDQSKDPPHRYGDLLLWKQTLLHAKGDKGRRPLPTIFVTNDRKEDWWRRRRERLIGPRVELVREYLDATGGQLFQMYLPDEFLTEASKYLDLAVPTEAIKNVQQLSLASPVTSILRFQRMVLPDVATRVSALRRIHEQVVGGRVNVADDVNRVIAELGGPFADSYVAVPLFFALVHKTYGPVHVKIDESTRLRDRPIEEIEAVDSGDAFVERAHAAWIAQALFRLQRERLNDEELLTGLFGQDYPAEAPVLLRRGQEFLADELGYRP